MLKRFEKVLSSIYLPKIIHFITISADTEGRMLWFLSPETAQYPQGVGGLGWMTPVPGKGW